MKIAGAVVPFIVPALLIGAWFGLSEIEGSRNSLIADPRAVLATMLSLRQDLTANSVLSVIRLLFGVLFGTFFGVGAGVLLGRRPFARQLFAPTLNVLTAVPIIVLIPFFFMVFGIGEMFRIALIGAVVLLLVYQATLSAAKNFPREWLDLAAHREKTESEIAVMLIRSALPELVHAIRLGLLFGWLAVALGEKALAMWPGGGLGYQILRAREQGLSEELFAAVIVLGMIARTIDWLLGKVERTVSHWRNAEGWQQ